MKSNVKNEEFYVDIIGNTRLTANNHFEKWMNDYYFKSNGKIIKKYFLKLNIKVDQVLDIGCSHGSYYELWDEMGMSEKIGVDISEDRLNEAIKKGYNGFLCNATSLPFEDDSIEFASSNDMFVHVLIDDDKAKIIAEAYRVLKPGGYFIFNYAPTLGHGFKEDSVLKYCNFRELDTMIDLVKENTGFSIVDIKASHYKHRWFKGSHYILPRLQTRVIMPLLDKFKQYSLLDESLYSYIIVRKPE
ncbi:MAG: class I SAM-dependent methyltransferase [Acidaminobacteraceae bacterium]